MITPHLDGLPAAQRRLWPQLQPAAALGFVLYGGTAISLRLGHRQSVDFDFFTDRPLDETALRTAMPWLAQAVVLQQAPDTLTAQTSGASKKNAVNASFFGGISFGRLGEPDVTDDGVAQVASREDLLATKLKTLLQRVEAKDYTDIAALLESGASLEEGLAGARALFGATFQPSECLKALVYFQGGDLETVADATRQRLIAAVSAIGPLPDCQIVSRTLALPVDPPAGA